MARPGASTRPSHTPSTNSHRAMNTDGPRPPLLLGAPLGLFRRPQPPPARARDSGVVYWQPSTHANGGVTRGGAGLWEGLLPKPNGPVIFSLLSAEPRRIRCGVLYMPL